MLTNDEEIANLSDGEFKTLVIRMLTEMVEYACKIRRKSEGYENWNKGNQQEGREARTQIKNLEQKEEINIQPEKTEETRTQKNEEKLRNLQDNFKHCNILIIGVPEEEEEEQEIENLFEQVMKEDSSVWQRKLTSRKSRKLRESQRSWTQGSTHQGTS